MKTLILTAEIVDFETWERRTSTHALGFGTILAANLNPEELLVTVAKDVLRTLNNDNRSSAD